jgi:S-(hydroxymethyl)glutathione dehydrogenase/alcohol dehydrogenase
MTALGGSVYVVGLAGSGGELTLSLPRLLLQQKAIHGLVMGSGNPRRDIPRYADLYLQGRMNLDGLVSREIGLDEIDAGYTAARDPDVARVVITSF